MTSIKERIQEMNQFFYSRQTYPVERRLYYLKKLKQVLLTYQEEIARSLYKDFKKPTFETYMTEIYTTIAELNLAIKQLKKWAKPQIALGNLPIIGGYTKIIKEPYGICVIFSPFNYPFSLALHPLIGAIAAGNCVIIKPSEYTPYTNKIIKFILRKVFPPYYVSVIEGEKTVAHQLLNSPIDYIFFTGGTSTAKIVMTEAAKHLIPVTLELGGKSPVIVDETADLSLAAKRIIWGKFLNAGQTCVAPDYVLVNEKVADQFVEKLICVLKHMYYDNKKEMAHIINESQYVRLLQLINEDKICFGGHFNTDELHIEPTILYPIHEGDLCMQEEIFGPVLPIIPYKTINQAVRFVQRYPKPLSAYLFSQNQKAIDYLLKQLSFGGGCINDTLLHVSSPHIPFGGVGYSGMGTYHGYASFKTFTHEKPVFISTKKEIPLRYLSHPNGLCIIKRLMK